MPKSQKSGAEFSNKKNVAHPMYVSQWLMAATSNRCTKVNDEFPVISKKMRDELIVAKGLLFRRSGFYTAIKVFLQLGLTIELGEKRGKLLFKLVMLDFMCGACKHRIVDDDIAVQMLAKMARRMDKIKHFSASVDEIGNHLIGHKNAILVNTGNAIERIRIKLQQKFGAIQAKECKISTLESMARLPFEQDIFHKIPKIMKFIKFRSSETTTEPVVNYRKPRQIIRHYCDNTTFPDVNLLRKVYDELDVLQLLVDVENWVLEKSDENYHNFSVTSLRALATEYMSKADKFYKDDCFGCSKMVLVLLKIIQVCISSHKIKILLSISLVNWKNYTIPQCTVQLDLHSAECTRFLQNTNCCQCCQCLIECLHFTFIGDGHDCSGKT